MTNRNRPQRVTPSAQAPDNAQHQPDASDAPGSDDMPAPDHGAVTQDLSTEEHAPAAEQGPGRRTRVPFGATQQKLSYPPRPGFHRHWFRDDPGRVERAKQAGYDHVQDPQTSQPVTRLGGAAEGGGGLAMYLMEQPQHWHDEDVAAGQKPVDEIDRAIKHGAIGREKAGGEAETRYQPEGRGIKITAR